MTEQQTSDLKTIIVFLPALKKLLKKDNNLPCIPTRLAFWKTISQQSS